MQPVLIPAPLTLAVIGLVFAAGAVLLALSLVPAISGADAKRRLRYCGVLVVGAGIPVTLVMALSGPKIVDDEAVIDNIEHTYSVSDVSFADGGYDTDTITMEAGADSPRLRGFHGDDPVEFVVGFTGDKPTSIAVVGDGDVPASDLTR